MVRVEDDWLIVGTPSFRRAFAVDGGYTKSDMYLAPLRRVSAALLIGLSILCLAAVAQAPQDVRVALVIGNSSYVGAPLLNPANDARAMSDILRGLGFTVVELRDGRKAQMAQAIGQVRDLLKGKQGVGMLYYAGHGLQLDWRNYMVPVDAQLASTADVQAQTIDVNTVIEAFRSAGNRMNILVLDACRDNPFAATATGKGLAQLDAPPGTLLAYATAPGNVAEDGDVKAGNGLYTQFLLDEIKKPMARIEDVFKRVRLQVRQKSQGRQIPWESTSLEDDFFFNTGKVVAVARPDERAREAGFNAEKADWDRIKESRQAADFYAFLQKYPSGFLSEQAQALLERFEQAKIVAQSDRNGDIQPPSLVRYRPGDIYEYATRDGLTGLVVGRRTGSIVKVTEQSVHQFNLYRANSRDVLSPAGALMESDRSTFDPAIALLPGGEYQVGKRWSGRTTVTDGIATSQRPTFRKGWLEYEGRIVAKEKVTVPAGTFDAYKIQMDYSGQHLGRWRETYWMQPEWGFPVKKVLESRSRTGGPEIAIDEMVSREKGGT